GTPSGPDCATSDKSSSWGGADGTRVWQCPGTLPPHRRQHASPYAIDTTFRKASAPRTPAQDATAMPVPARKPLTYLGRLRRAVTDPHVIPTRFRRSARGVDDGDEQDAARIRSYPTGGLRRRRVGARTLRGDARVLRHHLHPGPHGGRGPYRPRDRRGGPAPPHRAGVARGGVTVLQ